MKKMWSFAKKKLFYFCCWEKCCCALSKTEFYFLSISYFSFLSNFSFVLLCSKTFVFVLNHDSNITINRELVILNFSFFYTIHWWNTNRVMLQFKKYSYSSLKQFIIVIHVLIFIVFKTNTSFSLDSLFLFFKSNFLKSRFSVDWVCLFVCLSVNWLEA